MSFKKRAAWFWREWVKPLLVIALLLGSFRSAVADWNDVPSGSMEPTILPGDRVFVNKLAYDLKVPFTTWRLARWGDPRRGDVVVLWSPYDERRLVKRVVGVPGDRIEVRDQRLWLDGKPASYAPLDPEALRRADLQPLSGPYVAQETVEGRSHAVMTAGTGGGGSSFGPTTIPPGHYFVMGDHRDDSLDSRYWGFVARTRIVGKATAVVLSLDPERSFRPRWSRFFLGLP